MTYPYELFRGIALLACAIVPLIFVTSVSVAALEQSELAIKATFLFKFASFVEWPPATFTAPDAPLTICVLATDPLAPLLEQSAAGQKVGNRSIAVHQLGQTDTTAGCHIYYFEPGDQNGAQIAQTAQNHPVLTVTSVGNAPPVGAMITFVVDENRVRFDIDIAAARHAGLQISSNLLALAKSVRRAP